MDKDPREWVEQFEIAKNANNWGNTRSVAIAAGHMKGAAARWYLSDQPNIIR